jgi:WhiB family redox-sensing transcriptional regulator
MANAACGGHDGRLWFPEAGETATEARMICAGCLVRTACLAAALVDPATAGIWGGLSARGRRTMRQLPAA